MHLRRWALVDYCKQGNLPLLIICDANAHNEVCGSSITNRRGSTFLEYLSSTDFDIRNKGDRTTFVTSRRQDVIDITLGSRKLALVIANWHVSSEATLSDHRNTRLVLRFECFKCNVKTYKNTRPTNWHSFRTEFASRLGKPMRNMRSESINNQAARKLQNIIMQSYEVAQNKSMQQSCDLVE